MNKIASIVIAAVAVCVVFAPHTAQAIDALQVRPLIYKETLEKGQTKRGAVDIANGSDQETEYDLSVRLFRQTSDNGALEFYDNPDITEGINLDATNILLKGKEAARITFGVDSSKLPSGDVFAVILVTTKHAAKPQSIQPAAQVGTLLVLENGTPGPRNARIDELNIPLFQTGNTVSGNMTVSNPAPSNTATGFFPAITVQVKPIGASTKFDGPLVYAGRSRTFDFSAPSSQIGIYTITVTANNVSESRTIVLITGVWRGIFFGILSCFFLIAIVMTYWRVRVHRKRNLVKDK